MDRKKFSDLRDEILLRFWDTPVEHQMWVEDTFEAMPGKLVRALSPYPLAKGEKEKPFVDAMVVDYEARANNNNYVTIVVYPGDVIQTSYTCGVSFIKPYRYVSGVFVTND